MAVIDEASADAPANKVAVATTPYNVVSNCFEFENEDQELWWKDTAPLLEDLMSKAGYSPHSQYQHLCFFYKHAIPALGPFPRPGLQQIEPAVPRGRSFELSANFQQAKTTIRYDFEPTSYLAGNPSDPFNQLTINQLLAKLAIGGANVDTRLHYHFQSALSLSKQNIIALRKAKYDLPTKQHMVAWDLKDDDNVMKMYFFPLAKAKATGVTSGSFVMKAVAGADPNIRHSAGFAMLDEYLREKGLLENVYILGWDCVDYSPRIKIYLADPEVTISKVKDLWTLGGRLHSPAILKGLDLLLGLWSHLNVPEGVRSTTELGEPEQEDGRSGLTFAYELRAGALEPQPKMYFPLGGENDLVVATGLASFFDHLEWTHLSLNYVTDLSETFSHVDLSVSNRLISTLSFAYSEAKGPYITSYYYSSKVYPWLGSKESVSGRPIGE